jgi:hypothetical protein
MSLRPRMNEALGVLAEATSVEHALRLRRVVDDVLAKATAAGEPWAKTSGPALRAMADRYERRAGLAAASVKMVRLPRRPASRPYRTDDLKRALGLPVAESPTLGPAAPQPEREGGPRLTVPQAVGAPADGPNVISTDAGQLTSVIAWQRKRGLTVDGVIGPETAAAMRSRRRRRYARSELRRALGLPDNNEE